MRGRVAFVAAVLSIVAAGPALAARAAATTSFGDDFESGGFSGDAGTLDFSGPWGEIGESDGPQSGDVSVDDAGGCATGRCLVIVGGDEVHGAVRRVDLDRATQAVLRFSVKQTGSPGGGALAVRISADGGRTWTTADTFGRNARITSPTVDISRFASSDSVVAFVTTRGSGQTAYVDDVWITAGYDDPPRDLGGDGDGPPAHANPKGKPHATTTTSTTTPPTTTTTAPGAVSGDTPPPPPAVTRLGGDILIGIALQYRSFAPPAWTASEESAIRSSLAAAEFSDTVAGIRTLRGDREPLTEVGATFTRPGPSVRSRFLPSAVLGALAAWATITGFERRKEKTPAAG